VSAAPVRWRRIAAIIGKELRDYRRSRGSVVFTMAVLPLISIALPMVQLFSIPASAPSHQLDARIGLSLIYMLLIPALVPSTLSAYSVVGERDQGTLEPVLITPISREEFLLGKALAALLPTVTVAYAIFGLFLAATAVFAQPVVVSAVFTGAHLLVQLLFTPLLAGWSIWVGIAISARSTDVRSAQQLSAFASLPPLALVGFMSFQVISPSLGLALGIGVALLVIDGLGWRAVAAMFDRERLLTGAPR
jgi:ABC-2 type transport system permease protein